MFCKRHKSHPTTHNKGRSKFLEEPQRRKNHLKLLNRITPKQPTMIQPAYLKALELSFTPVTLKYLKIIVVPVPKLPAWHPGKGDKGWVFTDEVFVN